jgi:hypothetical protein
MTEPGALVSGYGLEPAQTRSLDVNGTHAWVIPGSNGICLAIPAVDGSSIAVGCGSLAVATTGILQVQRPSTGPVVYGLVPNDDTVAVTGQDGTTSGLPVASNFFKYSGASVQSISIRDAAGSAVQTVVVAKP